MKLDRPGMLLGLTRNIAGLDGPVRMFVRDPRRVVREGQPVAIDFRLGRFIAEGELGIVIGNATRAMTDDAAAVAIAGWTIGNDITALDAVADDGYSQEGKGSQTPVWSQVVTDFDPVVARITVRVNGEIRVTGTMSQLRMQAQEIVAWVSRTHDLRTGDVILCGAPGTATPVEAGDVVRIDVDGLGSLENPIVARR